MEKELCFCIQDNKLYLEQVLVDYNDIPIFFVCKDCELFYVVLCSDIEELKYVIVNVSCVDLHRLIHGMLSMREVFTKQESYWEIMSGEEIEQDMVTCKSINELDCSVLPEAGACFEILTNEVASYVEKFDREFGLKESDEWLERSDFSEKFLKVICQYGPEIAEKFVEVYEGQFMQKIAVSSRNGDIGYSEIMNIVFAPNIMKSQKEHSEEWRAVEMKILAYAA